jgi:hypothetical protein
MSAGKIFTDQPRTGYKNLIYLRSVDRNHPWKFEVPY